MGGEEKVADASRARPASRIFLVRHGTTTMNVENRYRGRREIPLDAQGYQDAVDAARQLMTSGISAVYTGPLRRTIATAQIIADASEVPDIRILHGLINLDYGAWEGMTAEEAEIYSPREFEKYRLTPLECVCPDGERLNQGRQRMLDAVALIGSRHAGESVVAVTHAVMIRLLLTQFQHLEGEEWRMSVGRGSITEVLVQGDDVSFVGPVGAGGSSQVMPNLPTTRAS